MSNIPRVADAFCPEPHSAQVALKFPNKCRERDLEFGQRWSKTCKRGTGFWSVHKNNLASSLETKGAIDSKKLFSTHHVRRLFPRLATSRSSNRASPSTATLATDSRRTKPLPQCYFRAGRSK